MTGTLLFTEEQFAAPTQWGARFWHVARRFIPAPVAWRTLQRRGVAIGRIQPKASAEPDGDLNFDILIPEDIRCHCEVDPNDRPRLVPSLRPLRVGQLVRVTGVVVADLGHGTLELHPVTSVEILQEAA